MCIMCVCLFSALSRRVGALQISIIIIKLDYCTRYVMQCLVAVISYGYLTRAVSFFTCVFVLSTIFIIIVNFYLFL